jgi:hypothetical protein
MDGWSDNKPHQISWFMYTNIQELVLLARAGASHWRSLSKAMYTNIHTHAGASSTRAGASHWRSLSKAKALQNKAKPSSNSTPTPGSTTKIADEAVYVYGVVCLFVWRCVLCVSHAYRHLDLVFSHKRIIPHVDVD